MMSFEVLTIYWDNKSAQKLGNYKPLIKWFDTLNWFVTKHGKQRIKQLFYYAQKLIIMPDL